MLLSNCAVCGKKKLMFIKNKKLHYTIVLIKYKMNKIVNKFLLTADKFMPELCLREPGFTYSTSGPFTKYHEEFQNSEKQ